jgi:hypothetical protein
MHLTCSLLLLLALPASAPRTTNSVEYPNRDATLNVEGREVVKGTVRLRLSDRLSLRLQFNGRTVQVRGLKFETDETDWELVSSRAGSSVVPEEGPLQSLSVAWEPKKPGILHLPTLSLQYRLDEKRDWQSVRWEGLAVEVLTLDEKGLSDIRGETELEAIDPPAAATPFPIREVSIGGAILVVLLGVLLWMRRPRPPVVLPPDQKALRALDLLRKAAPSAHPPGWLHARISLVIRQYLEERHGLQAPRQTTEELLITVRQSTTLGDETLQILRELLAICDRVKFAGTEAAADSEEALTLAVRFITETAPLQAT